MALALACAGLVAPSATAARQLTPNALHQALLKAPVATSDLPAGYMSPRVVAGSPSTRAKSHHVVGEVSIGAVKAGTAGAQVLYIVFPTVADASADWADGLRHAPTPHLAGPSSVPKPSALFHGQQTVTNSTGDRVTIGTTILGYRIGNIIVEVETTSTSSTAHGDEQGAIALAKFALDHLNATKGRVA